ncbi:MAG: DsrE family protein [Nitrospiraceae bacterium]|nr:DsrE family protein [Nitrospiraceae bacterium]
MQETLSRPIPMNTESGSEDVFIVLCASGFENIARARSALMFASLAASANYRAILYCIQNAVDVMVRGAIELHDKPQPGSPTLDQRLQEALDMGVEIQCCTQTMANKNISSEDLLEGVKPAGAMNLIALTSGARGALCF